MAYDAFSRAAPGPAVPQTLFAPTDDGWSLAVHFLPARGRRRRHPILMVHGVAGNHTHFDLDPQHSLARAARRRGFDVYMVDLRGAGASVGHGAAGHAAMDWGFADYAERDVPAAMRLVCAHAGTLGVHGVGHSMGGMLILSQAVRQPLDFVSLVTIGSPLVATLSAGLAARERRLLQLAHGLSPAVHLTPANQRRFALRAFLGVASMVMPLSQRLADNLLLNVANCDVGVMLQLTRSGIHDIPMRLVTEIAHAMDQKKSAVRPLRAWGPPSGPYLFESKLDAIVCPVLALSGAVDRIAPPRTVLEGVARLQTSDVRYRDMGLTSGDRANYGHADLLVGRAAPDEVYPTVLDFLAEID